MPGRWETTRTEAFSDGVFSIASTLLVLDIAIPVSELDHLWSGIAHSYPALPPLATWRSRSSQWQERAATPPANGPGDPDAVAPTQSARVRARSREARAHAR
jgi:hypothetical protein